MNFKHRTWAEISIDALKHNVREIKSLLRPETKILGVIKSDAYGHGVEYTAKALLEEGVDYFAVAFVDEAVQLRNMGIDVPVMLLGYTPLNMLDDVIKNDIQPTVISLESAKALSDRAAELNMECKFQLKIDTGMSRVGLQYNEDSDTNDKTYNEILRILKLPNIKMEGMFTHFAKSDHADDDLTEIQFSRYMALTDRLEQAGIRIPVKHAANSAAILKYPHMQLDMVRAGIILYGEYPSTEMDKSAVNLQPVMTLKTVLTQIKTMHGGFGVSYGSKYVTREGDIIGTIPVGYADGYSRRMSGKAEVIAGGKRVPVVGLICMDQCMINLSSVNNINVEDEVVLIGRQGTAQVSTEEVAAWQDTINYEITCVIGKRVPRVYIENGKDVAVINNLV